MKKTAIILFSTMYIALCAAQTVVEVSEAGSLESKVGMVGTDNIKSLKIKGVLNGTDICYLRHLAGSNEAGLTSTLPPVEELDLSEADIVAGGDSYYVFSLSGKIGDEEYCYTEDHVLGDFMFSGCWGLTKIVLPKKATHVGRYCFLADTRLQSIELPEGVKRVERQAFGNCGCLSEVLLPSTILSVDALAFEGCYQLQSVICLSMTPPAYGYKAFPSPVTTTLFVKEYPYDNTMQNYGEADGWKNFNTVTTTDMLPMRYEGRGKSQIGQYDLSGCKLQEQRVSSTAIKVYIRDGRKILVK